MKGGELSGGLLTPQTEKILTCSPVIRTLDGIPRRRTAVRLSILSQKETKVTKRSWWGGLCSALADSGLL
jgi:hypothetical protein